MTPSRRAVQFRWLRALSLISAMVAAPISTRAQSTPAPSAVNFEGSVAADDHAGSDWDIDFGAGVVVTPRFIGASKLRTLALPTFNIRYQDWFFANPIKGVGVQTKPIEGLSLTAAVGVDLTSRNSDEDPRLHGLPTIDFAPALKLGAEYEIHDFTFSSELSQRIAPNAKSGLRARFEQGYNVFSTNKVLLTAGLFEEAMNKTFARNFISISPYQSSVTGLAPYDAKSGLLDAGVYAQALYRITGKWTVFSKVEYSKLATDAGDSPIVQKKKQGMLIFFVSRSF